MDPVLSASSMETIGKDLYGLTKKRMAVESLFSLTADIPGLLLLNAEGKTTLWGDGVTTHRETLYRKVKSGF